MRAAEAPATTRRMRAQRDWGMGSDRENGVEGVEDVEEVEEVEDAGSHSGTDTVGWGAGVMPGPTIGTGVKEQEGDALGA